MKKIVFGITLLMGVMACKKETKTITKVNPSTGKTETVKVEASPEEVKPLAIRDSAGIYQHYFILEKGETYPMVTYQRAVNSMTDPTGKTMQATQESTDEMNFLVKDYVEGIYTMQLNLVAKSQSSNIQGKAVRIDTRGAAPSDNQLKMMWTVNKALVDNQLEVKMNDRGQIKTVIGFDPIYTKVENSVAKIVKDAKQRKAFVENFKQGFNEKALKDQLEKNFSVFPKGGAKIGQKWNESQNLSPDGEVKMLTNYTFQKINADVAEVNISGGIPKKSKKQTQQGVTQSVSIEGKQSGTIRLDVRTGWMLNSVMNLDNTQKQSLSQGGKTQGVTQSSKTTISINPVK